MQKVREIISNIVVLFLKLAHDNSLSPANCNLLGGFHARTIEQQIRRPTQSTCWQCKVCGRHRTAGFVLGRLGRLFDELCTTIHDSIQTTSKQKSQVILRTIQNILEPSQSILESLKLSSSLYPRIEQGKQSNCEDPFGNLYQECALLQTTVHCPLWQPLPLPKIAKHLCLVRLVLIPRLLQTVILYGKCCAPTERCGTPRFKTKRKRSTPKEKITNHNNHSKYDPLHCRGGPIKQQLERSPHYSTNNVQTSVAYNNPNQHCAHVNLATCCDSQ